MSCGRPAYKGLYRQHSEMYDLELQYFEVIYTIKNFLQVFSFILSGKEV